MVVTGLWRCRRARSRLGEAGCWPRCRRSSVAGLRAARGAPPAGRGQGGPRSPPAACNKQGYGEGTHPWECPPSSVNPGGQVKVLRAGTPAFPEDTGAASSQHKSGPGLRLCSRSRPGSWEHSPPSPAVSQGHATPHQPFSMQDPWALGPTCLTLNLRLSTRDSEDSGRKQGNS